MNNFVAFREDLKADLLEHGSIWIGGLIVNYWGDREGAEIIYQDGHVSNHSSFHDLCDELEDALRSV